MPAFHSKVSSTSVGVNVFVSMHISVTHLESKTEYTFIPLPSIKRDPFMRPKLGLSPETGQLGQQWDHHFYPYETLPDLECLAFRLSQQYTT